MACISEPLSLTKSYHRVQGFRQGLAAHGIQPDDALFAEANFRQRSGELAAEHLLAMANPPTAIVACNDLLALGALNAARKRGLLVGHDLSVTGFDDIMPAEYASPPLTTLHQPAEEMGRLVTAMLLRLIKKEPLPERQIIIEPVLVIRSSTGPPPIGQPRLGPT